MALADPGLQGRLHAIEDKAEFTTAVIGLAADAGFEIDGDDVEEAMKAGRRAWIERWI